MPNTGDGAQHDLAVIRVDTAVALRRRSRLTAGLLGVLFGSLGAHRLYLGYTRLACWQLALTIGTGGLAGIWGLAEGWLILAGPFGRDARGCGLTRHSAVHLLAAATVGGMTLGTTLGAVWLSQSSLGSLVPPPRGVNSIALSPATPASASNSNPIVLTAVEKPGIFPETEPLPEIESTSTAATAFESIMDRAAAVDAPLTPTAVEHTAPTAESKTILEPPTNVADTRSSTPVSRSDDASLSAPPIRDAGQAAGSPPQPHARTSAEIAPSTSEAVAVSLPSPASVASRESRGFDTDSLPAKLETPQPVYPPELRRRGVEGVVKLRVRVGADGRVKRASVYRTSGYAAFDRAALEAIDEWRFEPAHRGGIAVEMEIAVPIRFVIDD